MPFQWSMNCISVVFNNEALLSGFGGQTIVLENPDFLLGKGVPVGTLLAKLN